MALPELPAENEDPWFVKRNAFDQAVKSELEGRLSEAQLSATIGDVAIPAAEGAAAEFLGSNPGVVSAAEFAVSEALTDANIPTGDGEGELIIRGANGTNTWMQARNYVDAEGIAGPTLDAVAALGRGGVVTTVVGAPPTDLSLPAGVARIYLNDGAPVLAIGD